MSEFRELWVERTANIEFQFVYSVRVDAVGEWVYLCRSMGHLLPEPLLLGKVVKLNNRGMTFRTFFLDTNGTDVFLDRGKFDIVAPED